MAVLGRVAIFTAGGAEALRDQSEGTDLTDRLARLGFDPYRSGPGSSIAAVAARPAEMLSVVAESLPGRLATVFLVGGWGPLGEPLPSLLGQSGILARAVILLLALAGGLLLVRGAHPNPRAVAWLMVLYVLAAVLPFLVLGKPLVRYRAPADPVFVLWAVAGAWACWRLAKRLTRPMSSTQLPIQET